MSVLRPLIFESGKLRVLDQRELPAKEVYLELETAEEVFEAIRSMVLRGAPLIGVAAAYGVVLAAQEILQKTREPLAVQEELLEVISRLRQSRPTAVNLQWALDRMTRVVQTGPTSADWVVRLLQEARAIEDEERARCEAIAQHGLALFDRPLRVLTICNTGRLATPGIGTALGIIYQAHEMGKIRHVWVPETRPWLQGARLTTYELHKAGVPFKLIVDSMAPVLMAQGKVDLVIVGADRIARNGDTANKIGTFALALAAHEFGIPFYVAAPLSSFDLSLETGAGIPIEERGAQEVLGWGACRTAPPNAPVLNFAFDVTPGAWITGFITESGILTPPFSPSSKPFADQ